MLRSLPKMNRRGFPRGFREVSLVSLLKVCLRNNFSEIARRFTRGLRGQCRLMGDCDEDDSRLGSFSGILLSIARNNSSNNLGDGVVGRVSGGGLEDSLERFRFPLRQFRDKWFQDSCWEVDPDFARLGYRQRFVSSWQTVNFTPIRKDSGQKRFIKSPKMNPPVKSGMTSSLIWKCFVVQQILENLSAIPSLVHS